MSPAKKATKKKATKKSTTKKTAARKRATPKAAKKKVTKKVSKKTAKKASKKSTQKATKKASKKSEAAEEAPPKPKKPGNLVVARGKQVSKLGDRWTCWGCEAVFYDLNQPAAICPRCGQNQAEKPNVEEEKKKPARRDSMRALRVLDDDDGPATDPSDTDDVEMDLELGTDEPLLDEADDDVEIDED